MLSQLDWPMEQTVGRRNVPQFGNLVPVQEKISFLVLNQFIELLHAMRN